MRIYLKNNPAKFHPDPIWNDEGFNFMTKAFLKRLTQQEEQEKEKTRWVALWEKFLIQKTVCVLLMWQHSGSKG